MLSPIFLAASAHAAIARLPVGMTVFGKQRGSAFLISDCDILTAKHVLPRKRATAGLRGRFRIHGRDVKARVVAVGSASDPWRGGDMRQGDWAVARLDKCLGASLGYFLLPKTPTTAASLFRRPLGLAGVYRGRGYLRTSQDCGALALLADHTLQLACEVEPGQSGGPVFVRDGETGALTALAIISARSPGTAISFAAELPDLGPFGPFRTILSKMEETRTALR